MQITLDNNRGKYYIRSYQPGELKINDQIFQRSVILTSDRLIDNWPPQTAAELQPEHLTTLIELKPEVALIGTGTTLILLKPQLLDIFYQHKIGIEIMDTNAACRTYNVLTAEGRNVAAGLLMI